MSSISLSTLVQVATAVDQRRDPTSSTPISSSSSSNVKRTRKRKRTGKGSYINLTDRERQQIITMHIHGSSVASIIDALSTSDRKIKNKTVYSVIFTWKKEHRVLKKPKHHTHPQYTEEMKRSIREWQDEKNDITYSQLREKFKEKFPDSSLPLSNFQIYHTLTTATPRSFSTKQLEHVPREQNTPENIRKRKEYCQIASRWNDTDLIFSDEFGVNLHIKRGRGRSRVGTPAFVCQEAAKGANISIIAAVSPRYGLVHYVVNTHTTDTDVYARFIDELCRTDEMKRSSHKIIIDNASIHSKDEINACLEACSVHHEVVYLPPYSPQLNIIEKAFSKWQAHIKTASKRTQNDLIRLIHDGAALIADSDCAGWYRDTFRWYVHCAAGNPLEGNLADEVIAKPPPKKRGRKPKPKPNTNNRDGKNEEEGQ